MRSIVYQISYVRNISYTSYPLNMYVCMYMYICKCMCVCVCVCVCIHIHIYMYNTPPPTPPPFPPPPTHPHAQVILAVTKGGANLLAVAKLFFRLSKTPANDAVLRGEGVCEGVVTALRAGGRLESVLGVWVCGCVGVGVCCEERACVNVW
jgi:hypothetical protein